MTTIYLIRHAEAEGNLYRRIHGQYDSLITENGYRQIRALEQRFADVPIDAVYSSDLYRTMTTAKAVYVPKDLPLHTRPDLRELSMGQWEDDTFAGIARTDPAMMQLFGTSSPEFRAPGGESFGDIQKRGMAAILDIAAHHPGQTVAVFAHGTIIRNILAGFLGYDQKQIQKMGHSDNTAVCKLEIEGDHVDVVYMNDNSHLTDEISTLARQHWWNKNSTQRDVNFWFTPFDLDKAEDRDFYTGARAEIWKQLCGNLDRYDGPGFLADAKAHWRGNRNSLVYAMDGDDKAGVLQLAPEREADLGKGSISFLYLVPQHRRNGEGVQLIGQAVSLYRPLGRTALSLLCSEANKPALGFYEKYGFRTTGTEPGAYGTLYQMEKDIGYHWPEENL